MQEYTNFKIQGLGPIKCAEFKLKPLTIFTGQNVSGKSYVAILVNALMKTFSDVRSEFLLKHLTTKPEEISEKGIFSLEKWKKFIKENPERVKNQLIEKFSREIERAFSEQIINLVNKSIGKIYIEISTKDFSFEYELTTNDNKPKGSFKLMNGETSLLVNPMKVYFLPAARSGILQSYRALTTAIISEAPLLPIKGVKIPKISGLTADFIENIIEIRPQHFAALKRENKMAEIARFLEREILSGEIKLKSVSEESLPDIFYSKEETEVPIHRASSMISELTPLVLFLKYVMEDPSVVPSLLIFEEPEAHLHPGAQRKIAQLLTKLVRNGVYVLITTHSDFLLHELNNLMLLSRLNPEEREREGYDKEDYLKGEEVGAYIFKMEKEGSITRELEIVNDEIPIEEFDEVAKELYDKYTKIFYSTTKITS